MLDTYKQMLADYAGKLQTYTYPKITKKKPEEIKPSDLKPQPPPARVPVEKVLPIPETLPDIVEVVPVATGDVVIPLTPAEEFEKELLGSLREELKKAIQRYRDHHNGKDPTIYSEALEMVDKGGKVCQRGFTYAQCADLKDPDLHLIHSALNMLTFVIPQQIAKLKSGEAYPNKLWEYRILGKKTPYES